MSAGDKIDLIILVPGKDEQEALDGLLKERCESLGMAAIGYDFLVSNQRDPGCYQDAHALLRPYLARAEHALVVFDHYGSGQDHREAVEVETEVEGRLSDNGWNDRAKAIVLRPELETWVWSRSPRVDEILGWHGRNPSLRSWLRDHGYWPEGHDKPPQPKRSLLAALREIRRPQSPRLFRRLAERVSLTHCRDDAFDQLSRLLRHWFPAR